MKEVRVRFAPSPTGYLHMGGARTALFNWLFARNKGGTFIVRIEDTDVERSTKEAIDQILDSLRWLGIDWDEGPYFQSQRIGLYEKHLERLKEKGAVYKCFCSEQRLEELRDQAKRESRPFVYDRHCLLLSSDEIQRQEAKGEPFAFRFKVDKTGRTVFNDLIRGKTQFDNEQIGDFIVLRSGGLPTYNFACVVDDIEMKISHVIRGEDHLSNTPRQILIYQALEEPMPEFAHLPLILGPDRTRLSKRHGATAVDQFRDEGYLPEAVMNFLALLGWSYDDSTEIFSRDELIQHFSLERVGRAAAIFDYTKLNWMSGLYMRSLPEEMVIERVIGFLKQQGYEVENHDRQWLAGIIRLEIERSKTLKDFGEHLRYFFVEQVQYDQKAVEKIFLKDKDKTKERLHALIEALEKEADFSHVNLEKVMRDLTEKLGVKFGKLAQPARVALTGGTASPGIFDVIHFLGKERTLHRLKSAVHKIETL